MAWASAERRPFGIVGTATGGPAADLRAREDCALLLVLVDAGASPDAGSHNAPSTVAPPRRTRSNGVRP